jgi:hypothetical protein
MPPDQKLRPCPNWVKTDRFAIATSCPLLPNSDRIAALRQCLQ